MTPLETAHAFMVALEARDPDGAAALCATDVTIRLPGGDNELEGRDAARKLIRMAPAFRRLIREEVVEGSTVILKGLTRAPGLFTNFTTWTFETDGERITHLTFQWRPGN
ncbi:MAG: nuclear transport factor 2 family protein [Chloroflexi bacterium]|nr:nuclear transport factor 2 family protein [Chloroflexota bacterium]